MDTSTPDGANVITDQSPISVIPAPDGVNHNAEQPVISIIPAPSSETVPQGETNIYGTIPDDFSKSTPKLDKTVDKIRASQGEQILPTNTSQHPNDVIMEHGPTETKAPEIIFLDSSNSSHESPKNFTEQKQPLHSETPKSPHSSSVYKTPPSSPKGDSISDLNDEDIEELNKNFF